MGPAGTVSLPQGCKPEAQGGGKAGLRANSTAGGAGANSGLLTSVGLHPTPALTSLLHVSP